MSDEVTVPRRALVTVLDFAEYDAALDAEPEDVDVAESIEVLRERVEDDAA